MRFCGLGSGSAGNATLVEHTDLGVTTRVLLDCGLPLKLLIERLLTKGVALSAIDAIFVTHEHSDHIGCARQLAAQTSIPLWMSRGTFHAIGCPDSLHSLRFAKDGHVIGVGSLTLRPFSVPHDAKEPLQLVIASAQHRLGLLTDLGHVSRHVLNQLQELDALILECNHDAQMLRRSRYPPFLKLRVGGDYGHLSNQQALDCLEQLLQPKLRHVVAGHLSEQNNHQDLVRDVLTSLITRTHARLAITIAQADTGFDWIEL